jgi:hypothetical protein
MAARVRIQKPLVAVCPNLFASLPNIFYHIKLLDIADVVFEVEIQ